MRLSYTDTCLIVDSQSPGCHDVIAAMTTSRSSFSASSVLQRALLKPLGGVMLALCAIVCATQSYAADLPVLKVGDQSLQTRGILEASGQLKDLPYKIEWFNFPAARL
jgi:sulfonate transport system substrate-binding protein